MRILYISFFSQPLNSIPSLRTNAFLKYLPESGIEVDLLSRFYDTKFRNGNDFNVTFSPVEELEEPYLKIDNIVYSNFKSNTKGINFFNALPSGLKTIYSFFQKDIYHKEWVKGASKSFDKTFASNKYDFIIASYGPIAALQLAGLLSKKYGIPWVADFRDLLIGTEGESKFTTLYKKQLLNVVLKSATGIFGVCQGIIDQLDKYCSQAIKKIPKEVVNNGVDAGITPEVASEDCSIVDEILKVKHENALLLVHTGTIYEGQDIDFFLDFIKSYNLKSSGKIQLVCLGLTKDQIDYTRLTEGGALVFGRVKNCSSLFIQNLADALIIPAWYQERYTGFVGKIFEYIHSGNNVLCSPKPPLDLKEFLGNFENVFIPKDGQDFERQIDYLISIRSVQIKKQNKAPELYRAYWIQRLANFLRLLIKAK